MKNEIIDLNGETHKESCRIETDSSSRLPNLLRDCTTREYLGTHCESLEKVARSKDLRAPERGFDEIQTKNDKEQNTFTNIVMIAFLDQKNGPSRREYLMYEMIESW